MGRALAAVHVAHGSAAAAQFLQELRSLLPADQDEVPGFQDRLWQMAGKVLSSRWEDWALEEEVDEDEGEEVRGG